MPIVVVTSMAVDEYRQLDRSRLPRPACLGCGRTMQLWSGYPRQIRQRTGDGEARSLETHDVRIFRVHCPDCNWTPALLPSFLFGLRRDLAGEIGQALVLLVRGERITTAAHSVGRPASTVRDWSRRFRERAQALSPGMASLAVSWGWEGSDLPLESMHRCLFLLAMLVRQLERRGRDQQPWHVASWITGSAFLSTNTTPLPNSARIPQLLWSLPTHGP